MKDLFKFIDILSRITYKPEFKFNLEIHDWNSGCVELIVAYKTLSVSSRTPSIITHREIIKLSELKEFTEQEFIHLVYNAVTIMECHEQDEWFKVDGRTLKEPHPDETKT